MSITIVTEPSNTSAGYSALPIRATSSNVANAVDYNYLINIVYNAVEITNLETYVLGQNTYINCKCLSAHNFEVGETIMLDDSPNSDYYTNYYEVAEIVDDLNFVINATLRIPFGGSNIFAYSVIKYKMSPDPQNELKLDIMNTVKDFLTQNTDFDNVIIPGDDTAFAYGVFVGEEFSYEYEFEDNYFVSGNVGFVNSGLSASDIFIRPGDFVRIEQDLQEWAYDDNFFSLGRVGYTSSVGHNFRVGQQITVTGQETYDWYNGANVVEEVTSNSLVTAKPWVGSTPVEPGEITGIPRPEYNVVAQVTDVIDTVDGAVVVTNVGYTDATLPIGGKMTLLNKVIRDLNNTFVKDKTAYNARIDNKDWSMTAYDSYYLKSGFTNDISTIMGTVSRYRIERETKSFLLSHSNGYSFNPHYKLYDSDDNLLSHFRIGNLSGNTEDYYFQVGLDYIVDAPNQVLLAGATPSVVAGSVSYYEVGTGGGADFRCNPVTFYINDDCSKFQTYHLMWKDRLGSWTSYPFKYLSEDGIEVEKKNYYQRDGYFDAEDFKYDDWGRGETTYYARSRSNVMLNTGWIKEYENELIVDLIQSAYVYVQLPDGTLCAGQIVDKKLKVGTDLNDGLWQYKFNVKFTNNSIRL